MSTDEQRSAGEKFINKLNAGNTAPPAYNIGDAVITKGDKRNSYIGRIIGVGTKGIVKTFENIPLIDFGKHIGEFYIRQEKLKPV